MRLSLVGIDRLVRLDIALVALAVAVGVEDDRRPALRRRLVAGLVEHLGVEPADIAGARRRRRESHSVWFVILGEDSGDAW